MCTHSAAAAPVPRAAHASSQPAPQQRAHERHACPAQLSSCLPRPAAHRPCPSPTQDGNEANPCLGCTGVAGCASCRTGKYGAPDSYLGWRHGTPRLPTSCATCGYCLVGAGWVWAAAAAAAALDSSSCSSGARHQQRWRNVACPAPTCTLPPGTMCAESLPALWLHPVEQSAPPSCSCLLLCGCSSNVDPASLPPPPTCRPSGAAPLGAASARQAPPSCWRLPPSHPQTPPAASQARGSDGVRCPACMRHAGWGPAAGAEHLGGAWECGRPAAF